MKKFLQLTLLLSCLVMFCSHGINVVGNVDILATGYSLEENFNDLDLEETLSQSALFVTSYALAKPLSFFKLNDKKAQFTCDFIRAPPTYNI